ncbi:MAG TPA: PA0069 family radical SAM protein [Burkholderiales bacterium]|jgi:DNA repair photolyase|nr:PA0069 family radical SAM protein [Burkholderiales bacterium]
MTKLRGARSQIQGRFEKEARAPFDDGWTEEEQVDETFKTTVTEERSRSIVARNDSPDIPFEQSINAYRGCEHGCIYCYARPSHAYLELSPGLDFETKLFAKTNAVELLKAELSRKGYRVSPLAFGTNTDCYQPIERRYRLMRGLLEVLAECEHPLTIVTKSALIERDIDLLAPMAQKRLVKAFVSVTTLDHRLARTLEPRAASPRRRVDAIRALAQAGIPCGVMVAPLIPALTDRTLEAVLEAGAGAGATMAGWILLRLPNEVRPLFKEWLAAHQPQRAEHVMSIVRQTRGGRENDPNFGSRMTGSGNFVELIRKRFEVACRRLGLNREDDHMASRGSLDCTRFRPPAKDTGQISLF